MRAGRNFIIFCLCVAALGVIVPFFAAWMQSGTEYGGLDAIRIGWFYVVPISLICAAGTAVLMVIALIVSRVRERRARH